MPKPNCPLAWKRCGICLLVSALCLMIASCGMPADLVIASRSETTIVEEPTSRFFVIINQSTMVYHADPTCSYAMRMSEENRLAVHVPSVKYLSEHGYQPCSRCADRSNLPSRADA